MPFRTPLFLLFSKRDFFIVKTKSFIAVRRIKSCAVPSLVFLQGVYSPNEAAAVRVF